MANCGSRILSGNLLTRQVLQIKSKQIKWFRPLSTKKLTANQYDNLYADKWAKFQCELIYIVEVEFYFVSQTFVQRVLLCCRLSITRSSLCSLHERISYNSYTKQTAEHLFINYFFCK